jgi:hypothetical protein
LLLWKETEALPILRWSHQEQAEEKTGHRDLKGPSIQLFSKGGIVVLIQFSDNEMMSDRIKNILWEGRVLGDL